MRAVLMIVVCSVTLAAQQSGPPAVTNQDILAGLQDGTKWLTYSGNYFGHRHSPLTQITPENVGQLKSAVDIPDGLDRELPVNAARDRRRAVRHGVGRRRLGDRRAIGAADLALSAHASG